MTTVAKSRAPRMLLTQILYLVTLPVLLLAAWWISSASSTNMHFPPLADILAEFGPTWFEGRIVSDVLPSVGQMLIGYAIAVLVGVALGTLIGRSPALRAFLEPVLEFFRAIPPPVLIPVLLLFLGIGASMKIFLIAFGSLWPILLNTVEGVRAVDDVLRDTARTYRFGRLSTLRVLYLRGASPQIVAGARQALSVAIILMVISEMFAANNGLGFMIIQFQRSFALVEMWTGILFLGLIGILLSLIFRVFENRVLRWYHGVRRSEKGA